MLIDSQSHCTSINPGGKYLDKSGNDYFEMLLAAGERATYKPLEPGISDEDFLRNFIPAYKLAISGSKDEATIQHQEHLRKFLTHTLEAECLVPKGSEKSIVSTWSATLLTVLEQNISFPSIHFSLYGSHGYKKNYPYIDFVDNIFYNARSKLLQRRLRINRMINVRGSFQKLHTKQYKQEKFTVLPMAITNDHLESVKPMGIPNRFIGSNIYSEFLYDDFMGSMGLSSFYQQINANEKAATEEEGKHKKELEEVTNKKSKEINEIIKKIQTGELQDTTITPYLFKPNSKLFTV